MENESGVLWDLLQSQKTVWETKFTGSGEEKSSPPNIIPSLPNRLMIYADWTEKVTN